MKVCLSHMTALHWLLRHFNPRQRGDRASRAITVPSCAPGIAEAQEIRQVIGASLPAGKDGGEPPIDVVVSRREGRRSSAEVTSHLCSSRLPAGSFVPLHIRGFDLWVTSPELTFVHLAGELDVAGAAYVGMALCSGFRLEELDVSGTVRRRPPDEPLTTVSRIGAFLRRAGNLRGVAKARRALKYVRDGALSPPEAGIALVAEMRPALGGYSLGEVSLNEGFRVYAGLSPAGRPVFSTRYPDVVIRHRDDQGNLRLLGIDHDPTLTHGGELRRSLDLERGNQLESCRRLVHFTFTNLQTSDYSAFASSMDQVRRALGKRREPREEQGELARRIDCERRDLWERFVHGWSTML